MTAGARWIWHVGFGSLFASALGCGLIVGFGDLTAPDGGRSGDTGPSTPDAADGGRGSHDARVDGGEDSSWCAHRQVETFGLPEGSVQHFCDDFDEDRADGSLRNWMVPSKGGTVELQTKSVSSPPLAVRTSIPLLGGDGGLNATTLPQLTMSLGETLVEARCVFDFNVDSLEPPNADPNNVVEILAFTMTFGTATFYTYGMTWVVLSPPNMSYVESYLESMDASPGAVAHTFATLAPAGVGQGFLTDIAFSLRRVDGGPDSVFSVSRGGVEVGSLPLGVAPTIENGFVIGLGFTFAHSYAGGSSIDFDNVACDWH